MWRRYKSAWAQDVFSHRSGMNTVKSRYKCHSLVPEVCIPQGICSYSVTGLKAVLCCSQLGFDILLFLVSQFIGLELFGFFLLMR